MPSWSATAWFAYSTLPSTVWIVTPSPTPSRIGAQRARSSSMRGAYRSSCTATGWLPVQPGVVCAQLLAVVARLDAPDRVCSRAHDEGFGRRRARGRVAHALQHVAIGDA